MPDLPLDKETSVFFFFCIVTGKEQLEAEELSKDLTNDSLINYNFYFIDQIKYKVGIS